MKKIISILLAVSILFGFGWVMSTDAEAVSLSTKTVKLIVGEEEFVFLEGAKADSVKWSSSDKKVANVTDGVIRGLSEGTATVTASYKNKSYKCKVTVSQYRIDRDSSTVMVGNRLKLNLVGWSGNRSWRTSDKSVATVSEDGILRGVSEGTATISVVFNKKQLSFKVTVKDYSFPISASKTAYIKVSHRYYDSEESVSRFITDKNEIKQVISYADSLGYSFVEPAQAETIAAEGYSLADKRDGWDKAGCESVVFYDKNGKELGRFETALTDSVNYRTENILGYFHYNQKCYRVGGTNNMINRIYGWKTNEELLEIAENALNAEYDVEDCYKIVPNIRYNVDMPDFKTKDGITLWANYFLYINDCEVEYVTFYIDPLTGEVMSGDVLVDD